MGLKEFSSLFKLIEYSLTIGEREVGRALYKSKNNCRVAKFKKAKRGQEEKKTDDKLISHFSIRKEITKQQIQNYFCCFVLRCFQVAHNSF